MQLQITSHMQDPYMYQVPSCMLNPITRSCRQLLTHTNMDLISQRHNLLISTILCSLEHLKDQISLPAHLNGSLHNRIIRHRTPPKAKASMKDLKPIITQGAYLMRGAYRTTMSLDQRGGLMCLLIMLIIMISTRNINSPPNFKCWYVCCTLNTI